MIINSFAEYGRSRQPLNEYKPESHKCYVKSPLLALRGDEMRLKVANSL
jgi:hypothetical protein